MCTLDNYAPCVACLRTVVLTGQNITPPLMQLAARLAVCMKPDVRVTVSAFAVLSALSDAACNCKGLTSNLVTVNPSGEVVTY